MKPLIYYAVIITLFSITMVGYSFSYPPLKFKLNSLYELGGWLLIFAGIIVLTTVTSRNRYNEGYIKALDDATELIKKQDFKHNN